MPSLTQFLVVDDNTDSRFLLVKTLLRKFPQAVIRETQDGDAALTVAGSDRPDAVIVHRAADVDGITLVQRLREGNPTVPIVMVSGIDRSQAAVAAGATTFLNYDAWLRIGSVVADVLARAPTNSRPNTAEPPAPSSSI